MTEESAVKVCVRVRPLVAREESSSENVEPIHLFWKCDDKSIHQMDDGTSTKSFVFDRVFTAEETTKQLYQDIAKPLVVSTVQGYNGTIFAYGQTSSGKTFTMMGRDHTPGVIPLAVEDVFQTIKNCPKKEFLLRVSYMEIYNETVSDLLVDSWKRKPLEVREALNKTIYVADLTEELVTSPAQALSWIRKGEKNRHYGKTKMNQRSSRSHTIFRMILESRERSDLASGENADGAIIVSHLNLVDLAGSERASQTGAEGTRFKEGCNINRSLFTLGQVIKKLTDESQKGFTNYRDSKLTRILQNSLGGNAKTVIICTITPVTLEETLSTLQFASTAKKMKNDPHVTEVSDDGALLRRYRNEIADLKRRLQEVSSVTHTTATEREVLSQLIQEKDQLQREQQDRIRNLTKLLVTSSNLDLVRKMPKRRVTWGGKMLKLTQASVCDGDVFGSFSQKRKDDRSCLSELGEEDEFDSQWEIPSDNLEMSRVTVHSFEESAQDFVSPDQMHELSNTVSSLNIQLEEEGRQKEDALAKVQKLDSVVLDLELQLEVKSREKEEASAKVDLLDTRVSELEGQLQTEAQQKQEAVEKILETGQKLADLELQLHSEAQQKLEAMEKVDLLMSRVADLERQLEEQSQAFNSQPDKEMRREFVETIQLCEALASEKEMVAAERDYLKQELGMFIEQTETLEKDKAALSQELKEKRDIDEFENLEHEFRREHENELQGEISRLKTALELCELQCQELQNKMAALSEDLRSKTELTEQLQSLNGKDLVQEVAKLRRSLDDAEGVSRDAKKDWAVLRSESIALEEMNATLTANYKKMEAQVNSLQFQLETERLRYKTMQSDLQKELNVAFEENTKLTMLLDGKVPKNLMEGVELERKVANLNKELAAAHKMEEALKAQLEELAAFQTPPETVDNLKKQVRELTEELESVQNERGDLLTEILNVQADLKASAQREQQLSQQCADGTQQLDSLRSELMNATKKTASKLEEHEQHRVALEDKLKETEQLVKDLEEKLGDSEMSRTTEEEISKELQEQVNQLTHELQCVRAEKDALLFDKDAGLQALAEMEQLLLVVTAERDRLSVEMAAETHRQKNLYEQKESEMLKSSQEPQCVREEADALPGSGAQGSTEEVEKLLSALASVSAERDQLKMDMQENVDMMIENQEELRTVLERNHELKGQIKQLEAAQASNQDKSVRQLGAQLEELQTHFKTLTEELGCVRAERDSLLSQRTNGSCSCSEEVDKLLCRVSSLNEEKDQLHEILEGLRQEKNQLKAELEDRMEMVVQAQCGFNQTEILTSHLQAHDEKMTQLQQEVTEAQCLIKSLKEQLREQKQNNLDLVRLCEQKECNSQQQTRSLAEELESTRAERNTLVFEKEANSRSSTEEMDKLQCRVKCLSEETDQLQETLEGVRQEKNQLRQELEDRMKTLTELNTSLQTLSGEKDQLERELQHSVNMTSTAQELLSSVEEELCRQKQINSDLLKQSQETECTLGQQIQTLCQKLESTAVQRDSLPSAQSSTEDMERMQCMVASLSEEKDQLHSTMEKLRQEKGQIKAELENRMETLQSQIRTLNVKLESVEAERDGLLSERRASTQTITEEMESLSEERDQLQSTLEGLTQERDQLQNTLEGLTQERDQLQNTLEGLTQERDQLQSTLEGLTQERDQLQSTLEGLTQERDQLQTTLEGLTQERDQLQRTLEGLTQERDQLQTTLEGLSQERDQLQTTLEGLSQERDQLQTTLEGLSQERDQLQNTLEGLSQERDQLQNTLEGLSQDRDQLQTSLERLTQERDQLRAEVSAIQQKLHEQEQLLAQQKTEKADTDLRQEMGSEAIMSSLGEQLRSTLSSRLQESTEQLEESFGKFRDFIDICSKHNNASLNKALQVQGLPRPAQVIGYAKPTQRTYCAIQQALQSRQMQLRDIIEFLHLRARIYRNEFEYLVKTDVAIFEEKRLQALLLCRVQEPSYSVKDEDTYKVFDQRLTELLDKRPFYLQKMASILEKFSVNMTTFSSELSAEVQDRNRFSEQLLGVDSPSKMEELLSRELDHKSAVAHSRQMTLQAIMDEHNQMIKELRALDAQADLQLMEERSKNVTLLKALEGAPLKKEVSLLKDNQQLVLQLQQTEEKVKVLYAQNKSLEKAQVEASTRVSNHKQATQLLQTELQDSRAQVEEKENMIQTLKSKLRESEKNASPSSVELKKLSDKIFKLEVELSSASDLHQQEIQRMKMMLNQKEDSLRDLKEALRREQQEGEGSFLTGKDLHARLTNSRGLVVTSSVLLDKNKLEDEVKLLRLKVTELESLVSSQKAEMNKWKNRAVKLKVRNIKDAPSSPCTPTKRGLQMNTDSISLLSPPQKVLVTPKKLLDSPRKMLDSPRKMLDSPRKMLDSPRKMLDSPRKMLDSPRKMLDSPRKMLDSPVVSAFDFPESRFFGGDQPSKQVSKNYPKQFFDNSSLGTIPDAAAGSDGNAQWWPLSPKQEEMCKAQ
ncbi:centromere-associated protein E isoform X2 [Betta splendens]|uniref:Centromere-associated protein E n=1 Tax=Betta splendens TaxID=158456 RepID=A0A6P7LSW7_BETSP|nr:centromere-associated protein E isoform X2 [Betta splendens]